MIVFEDEASFRQTPTLHATWAKRGSQPQIPRVVSATPKRFSEPFVSTTPVSSMPISGVTWPQPRLSLVVSPERRAVADFIYAFDSDSITSTGGTILWQA